MYTTLERLAMDDTATPHKKLRVLMIAELANPDWVSVPLVGWNIARHVGEICDVHLVTSSRNQENIDRNGFFKKNVTYIDQTKTINFLVSCARFVLLGKAVDYTTFQALTFIFYPLFEIKTWFLFRKKIKNNEFDLVHRATPLSPVIPSLLASLCKSHKTPFIIGPLNGGLKWPEEFAYLQSKDRDYLSRFRQIVRCLPFYKSTRRDSSAIIVGSNATLSELTPTYLHKCHYLPENGMTAQEIPRDNQKVWDLPLKVLFVGRLVALKGVDMVIEASAPLLRDRQITLQIIGDGPELQNLRNLAQSLGIGDKVDFKGWIDRKIIGDFYKMSHIFAFASIKEFGGGALIEAMSFGLIPIVADYGGPSEIVTSDCGFKVTMQNRDLMIQKITSHLRELASNHTLAKTLSQHSRQRIVDEYLWPQKAQKILAVYSKVHLDKLSTYGR